MLIDSQKVKNDFNFYDDIESDFYNQNDNALIGKFLLCKFFVMDAIVDIPESPVDALFSQHLMGLISLDAVEAGKKQLQVRVEDIRGGMFVFECEISDESQLKKSRAYCYVDTKENATVEGSVWMMSANGTVKGLWQGTFSGETLRVTETSTFGTRVFNCVYDEDQILFQGVVDQSTSTIKLRVFQCVVQQKHFSTTKSARH